MTEKALSSQTIHNLAKAGPLPTSWNLFYERAQNQVALLSLLYDPAGPLSQKVHYQERSAFLEALLQKHRSNTEAFPLRILMDIWSEVWHDFDSRIKSSLAALFPETLAAGVRDCILRGQQQGQSFNYPDSFFSRRSRNQDISSSVSRNQPHPAQPS